MYAYLTITTDKPLPSNDKLRTGFTNHFRNEPNHQRALKSTSTMNGEDQYEWLKSIILHSFDSNKRVFIVSLGSNTSLNVHIELPDRKNRVPALKKELEWVTNEIKSMIESLDFTSKISVKSYTGDIYSEGSSFQGILMPSWKNKAVETIKVNFEAKIYLPIATLVFSYFIHGDVNTAWRNTFITIGAFLIWIIIDATFIRRPFLYKEYKED